MPDPVTRAKAHGEALQALFDQYPIPDDIALFARSKRAAMQSRETAIQHAKCGAMGSPEVRGYLYVPIMELRAIRTLIYPNTEVNEQGEITIRG
jgi:hypothetical protein